VLQRLDVQFSVVVTRDTGVGLKPSPEPLLYITNKWRLKPQQVMMVGDFLYDILMGKRAGCQTAFVTNGKNPPEGLDCDIVVSRLEELIPFLTRNHSIK
jgi:phosphoglycolate phosphatase